MRHFTVRKGLGILAFFAFPIIYLNIEVWAQNRGFDRILIKAEDIVLSSGLINFFVNPVWFAASLLVLGALLGAWLNHFFARRENDCEVAPYSKYPHHRFPPPNFESFLLRTEEDTDCIWLHWTSPTSSSLLKIGLDIKRQGQGEVGMLLSENPATTKGQENTTLLCKKNESGQWVWASKQPSVIAQQAMKCYFTILDDKDRRWHWGFAVPARSDATEEPKIVGDDIYHMSQRKMF